MKLRNVINDKPSKDGLYWISYGHSPTGLLEFKDGEWVKSFPVHADRYNWIDFEFEGAPVRPRKNDLGPLVSDEEIGKYIKDWPAYRPKSYKFKKFEAISDYLTKHVGGVESLTYNEDDDFLSVKTAENVYKIIAAIAYYIDHNQLYFDKIRVVNEHENDSIDCDYK